MPCNSNSGAVEAGGPTGQGQEVTVVLSTTDLCGLGVGVVESRVGSGSGGLGMGGGGETEREGKQ